MLARPFHFHSGIRSIRQRVQQQEQIKHSPDEQLNNKKSEQSNFHRQWIKQEYDHSSRETPQLTNSSNDENIVRYGWIRRSDSRRYDHLRDILHAFETVNSLTYVSFLPRLGKHAEDKRLGQIPSTICREASLSYLHLSLLHTWSLEMIRN